ncbi:hypothetical protein LUZ60_013396 [Juncus effusus]|nr:hypothetical protein LUZ60_013396 [Juncus effusus]
MLQQNLWRSFSFTKPLSALEGRRYTNLSLSRQILHYNSRNGIKTFSSRKSERKLKKRIDLKAPRNTSLSEKITTEDELEAPTNIELPSGDTSDGQLAAPSRSQVLQACIATSAGLLLFGILIRQGSHLGFINGWPIHDASEISFGFETWHAGLVLGQVTLISSSRFILLKAWPDFAKSSEAANQQILSSLEPLDLVVIAFLPGISEEFLFRGGLMPLFGLDWKSALATGVVFGILHLNGGRKYDYAIWATLVGFAYGLATIASSSLLVPMASHSLNNLIGALFWRFKDFNSIKTLK